MLDETDPFDIPGVVGKRHILKIKRRRLKNGGLLIETHLRRALDLSKPPYIPPPPDIDDLLKSLEFDISALLADLTEASPDLG